MQKSIDLDELRTQLWGSFLGFCQVFYPLVTGREFKLSSPLGRESHFITIARELTLCKRLELQSLLINVPPGHGKSVMISMWIAWTLSEFPDSQYLYVSYGHDLAAKHTEFIRRIIQCPYYGQLFDVHVRHDMKAKDHFMTNHGGSVKAFGSSGPITGCFPHDEIVLTESGPMQIGDVVNSKLQTKVWSLNLATNALELKPIIDWYINPPNDIVEVKLNNNASIRCTPDHKIWTTNRGWVQAKRLLSTDNLLAPSPNSALWNAKQLASRSLLNLKISQNIKMLFTQALKFCFDNSFGLLINQGLNFTGPSFSSSYFSDVDMTNAIFRRNQSSRPRIHQDCFNLGRSKRGIGMNLTHTKCAMCNSILHVVRFVAITKVIRSVIKSIAIHVSRLNLCGLRANKRPSYKTMNGNIFAFLTCFCKSYTPISFTRAYALFFYACRNPIRTATVRIKYLTRFLSNPSKTRDAIEAIIPGNCSPLFVINIGHADTTYCINVDDNHNFFVGTQQAILVSNCDAGLPNQDRFTGSIILDDLHKPDEAASSTIREGVIQNYRETILQRPRAPNVPMIFIGQRLHEDDICAHMLSGNDERIWKPVILQSLDGAGNALYPEVNPLEQLLEKKLKNPYVFSSQYQQEPIPSGGALYKERDFAILEEEPEFVCTFLTVDTAETSKTYNDASVFHFWGLYKIADYGQSQEEYALHSIDCWEMRVEPKELEPNFKSFWSECMLHKVKPRIAIIEKKSTGVTLLSVLQDMRGLELREVKRTKASGSKTARFLELQPIIASKLISFTRNARHFDLVVKHMLKITANGSHRHDDICDTIYDAAKIALIDKTLWMRDVKTETQRTASRLNAQEFNTRLAAIKAARGY